MYQNCSWDELISFMYILSRHPDTALRMHEPSIIIMNLGLTSSFWKLTVPDSLLLSFLSLKEGYTFNVINPVKTRKKPMLWLSPIASLSTITPNIVENSILDKSSTPYTLMGTQSIALNDKIHAKNITKLLIAIKKKYLPGIGSIASPISGTQNKNAIKV